MPVETGELIVDIGKLIGKNIPLHKLANISHSPFHHDSGKTFIYALLSSLSKLETIKISNSENIVLNTWQINPEKYYSSFSSVETRKRIHLLHESLRTEANSLVNKTA